MQKCRFCGTMDGDLIKNDFGIECDDEDSCNKRFLIRVQERIPEKELVPGETYFDRARDEFGEAWQDAVQAGDVGASKRLLVMLGSEKGGRKDR